MKSLIHKEMQKIALRKQGQNKLVYDKTLREIVVVGKRGEIKRTGLTSQEADVI